MMTLSLVCGINQSLYTFVESTMEILKRSKCSSSCLNSPSSHSEGLARCLGELRSSYKGLDVVLNCENSLVKLSIVVLLNSLEGVLGSLVDDCGRAQELAELVSVKLALREFADLLKESLKMLLDIISTLRSSLLTVFSSRFLTLSLLPPLKGLGSMTL